MLPTAILAHAWVPPFGLDAPNGPSWFLSCLLVCWLLAPAWRPGVLATRAPGTAFAAAVAAQAALPAALDAVGPTSLHPGIAHALAWNAGMEFSPLGNWPLYLSGLLLYRASEAYPFRSATAAVAALPATECETPCEGLREGNPPSHPYIHLYSVYKGVLYYT